MSRLHPAVRVGLACAAAHQACVLCVLASAWAAPLLFPVLSTLVFLDLPAIIIVRLSMSSLQQFLSSASLPTLPPELGWGPDGLIIFFSVLTLGALQWFAIGCALAQRQERRSRGTR